MTFSLLSEIAARFMRRVPARERSRYVASALAQKLDERERSLIRGCEIANADADGRAIKKGWDAIDVPIEEPWEAERRIRQNGRPPR